MLLQYNLVKLICNILTTHPPTSQGSERDIERGRVGKRYIENKKDREGGKGRREGWEGREEDRKREG